jgi:predicted dehydrogenase
MRCPPAGSIIPDPAGADWPKKWQEAIMGQQLRVGIIGTGKHGSRYARHISEDLPENFALTAISRRGDQGRQQAELWRTTWYPDWRELVSSRAVDVVISATTPDLNPEIGRLCAQEKKPLLLEKPLTTDYPEAARLVALFAGQGVPLTIAQTLRYNSIVLALKEHLARMGQLYALSACHRLEPSTLPWLAEPQIAGGGVIYHTAVHLFDALRFICADEIVRVRASQARVHNRQLEDLLTAEIVLSRGGRGVIDAGKLAPARCGRFEFVCAGGQLQGDQIHGTLQELQGAAIRNLPVAAPGPTILPLLEEWHRFLLGKGANPIPAGEGLAAVRLCHACQVSIASGDWVEVAAVG